MDKKPALRRLIDLPGVADLEFKALMKRDFAEPDARAEFPELDECSRKLFEITAEEAGTVLAPEGWDGVERLSVPAQVAAFEEAGWDLTDDKRRPLRIFGHFNQQLWLAIRGVAGSLPFHPESDEPEPWAANLAAEAARFRKR